MESFLSRWADLNKKKEELKNTKRLQVLIAYISFKPNTKNATVLFSTAEELC